MGQIQNPSYFSLYMKENQWFIFVAYLYQETMTPRFEKTMN